MPPTALVNAAPLAVKVPLPPVALSRNSTMPPKAPLTAPALAMKLAKPAVEVSRNCVVPPANPLVSPPLLLKTVWTLLPPLALLVKRVRPPKAPLTDVAIVSVALRLELFVTPTPLIVNRIAGLVMIV